MDSQAKINQFSYIKEQSSLASFGDQSMIYKRGIGAYKPHFTGMHEDVWPLSGSDIFWAVVLMLIIIGAALGMMAGFMYWSINYGTHIQVWVCAPILVGIILCSIFLIYFRGKMKIIKQREAIKEKLREQRKIEEDQRNQNKRE